MRDFRFRAWDVVDETMIYGSEEDAVFTLEDGEWSVKYVRERNFQGGEDGAEFDAPVWHEAEEIELMQFTGLLDTNGKECYEGDIFRNVDTGEVCFVEYLEDGFFTNYPHTYSPLTGFIQRYRLNTTIGNLHEIIGNIYENPELINQTE